MKKIKFFYSMKIDFSSPVIRHCYSLRCVPLDTVYQKIDELSITVEPNNIITETTDGFGNRVFTDRITQPHTEFSAIVEGKAQIDYSKKQAEALNSLYKYPSKYTIAGNKIKSFASKFLKTENMSAVQMAETVFTKLYDSFSYKSGSTNIDTTAEEALSIGCGVCQDYAHILISVCRLIGIPARYVAGIPEGTGETHAWAEVFENGIWTGVDPTNKKICDETYLVLSHGRDFADCGINRGLFVGGGTQTQKIVASVKVL